MPEETCINVVNPDTKKLEAKVPICGKNDVLLAVRRARSAQEEWGTLPFRKRAEYLLKVREEIVHNPDEIISTIQSETAKTTVDALTELAYVCGAIPFFARALTGIGDKKRRKRPLAFLNKFAYTKGRAWPVVGMITPWNLPFTLTFGEAIPYLVAGSAIVLKPSEYTPLSALLAQELCRRAVMPNGTFQVVAGCGETGACLVESSVDKIDFTGSARTGRKIAARCGELLRPFSLELGGKTPFLVLKENSEGNIWRAVYCAVWSAFANAGQYCKSTERLYVVREHANWVIAAIAEIASKLVPRRDYGPVIPEFQLGIIKDHVKDAVAKGAKITVGGNERASDHWYTPTVLIGANHSMKIMTEETFGPTLPIMVVENDEEAIRLANDCRSGLNAVVFSSNLRHAEEVADKIDAGTVTINDALINYMVPDLPYGGAKESGWSRRHGTDGYPEFVREQSFFGNSFCLPFRSDLWWFPYTKNTERLLRTLVRLNTLSI